LVVAARRRHTALALTALLAVLALPVLHPGAWAHRSLELDAARLELGSGTPERARAADDHLRCPLCRVLAQTHTALASPALEAPRAADGPRRIALFPASALPEAPAPEGPHARAPPLPA
jgi:hypothetical protein